MLTTVRPGRTYFARLSRSRTSAGDKLASWIRSSIIIACEVYARAEAAVNPRRAGRGDASPQTDRLPSRLTSRDHRLIGWALSRQSDYAAPSLLETPDEQLAEALRLQEREIAYVDPRSAEEPG